MSAEARGDLAAAASSVEGVNVTPNYRQITKPGQGCIRFGRQTADSNGFGFVTTWQVWIVLPTDVALAETWIDTHLEQLHAALKREWVGVSVTPAESVFGTTSVNVLILEGTR